MAAAAAPTATMDHHPHTQAHAHHMQQSQHALPPRPAPEQRILTPTGLAEIVTSVGGDEKLDAEVEQLLLELADEFVESASAGAALLARHRGSASVEASDLNVVLEKHWNLRIPGGWAADGLSAAALSASSGGGAASVGIGGAAASIAAGAGTTFSRTLRRTATLESHRKRLLIVNRTKARDDLKKTASATKAK